MVFGQIVLYSSERVKLGFTENVALTWRGKVASLKVGGSVTSLSVANEDEILTELTIGERRGLSFSGRIIQLSVNGRDLQRKDLKSDLSLRDMYVSPVMFENGTFIHLPNIDVEFRSKLQIRLSFNPSSKKGVIFMMDCFLRKDNRRSYLALILNHSRPHFFWDFGSGPVSLSAETPSVASWTAVKFTMTSSAANMHLNENAAGSRSFKAEGEQFAFGNCSVFLGGVPDAHLLPKELQHHANAFAEQKGAQI
ncbi:hypothetical protein RB195_018106 [Necator americanus]|uniref:Laminin G domain-containing protein n=1 Tax=Necator americanus TaxID=51031 RepID=A0ABR1C986_NECAM